MGIWHSFQTDVFGAEADVVSAVDADIPLAEPEECAEESGTLFSGKYRVGRNRSVFPSGISTHVYQQIA